MSKCHIVGNHMSRLISYLRSNSILDRGSSTDNGASCIDGEGSSSRASPFTTNVLSNAG